MSTEDNRREADGIIAPLDATTEAGQGSGAEARGEPQALPGLRKGRSSQACVICNKRKASLQYQSMAGFWLTSIQCLSAIAAANLRNG